MRADPERLARDAIADIPLKARNAAAACAVLMRLDGQVLAQLSDHDQAARVHASWSASMLSATPRWRALSSRE
jgi:hypothetical protein